MAENRRLAAARVLKGHTQRQLAELVGTREIEMCRIERSGAHLPMKPPTSERTKEQAMSAIANNHPSPAQACVTRFELAQLLQVSVRTVDRMIADGEGRGAQPSATILDSQSVKSDGHGGTVGYDAGKKINGRKRHLLVDTLGLVLGVVVTPADCPERAGAQQGLQQVGGWFKGLRRLWVDGGYTGEAFAQWVRDHWSKLEFEVVKRSDTSAGFTVLPSRWIVERTFGWLMRHRRLARDYERTEVSAESWIHLAMIRIQLRRLA